MAIIQGNRALSAPSMSIGGIHYVQAFSYDVGQGILPAFMTGLGVRTNTSPDNASGPSVTALGRGIGSTTSGAGTITIPNRTKYAWIRGHLRLRTGGSNDGWTTGGVGNAGHSTGTIDDNAFMDGIAITGKDSSGSNHTWLWGVLNCTYNLTEDGQGSRPGFVGANDYQVWRTTHGGSYTTNWEYWFNLDDPQGRPPVQDFYFERRITSDLDGDILVRIMSNQGWANEDTGIEQCTIWLGYDADEPHLQASDGNVRSYESHGILSHKLGDQGGYLEEKRWKHAQSAFTNPTINIGTAEAGAANHHMHFIVEVMQSVYTVSYPKFNMHRGVANYLSQASPAATVTSMVVVDGTQVDGFSNVGTLSWDGDTLQYTTNRGTNYDDYWIKVTYVNTGSGNFTWDEGFSRNFSPYPAIER